MPSYFFFSPENNYKICRERKKIKNKTGQAKKRSKKSEGSKGQERRYEREERQEAVKVM